MLIPGGYGQVNLKFTGASLPFGAQMTWGFQDVLGDDAAAEATLFANMWDAALLDSLQCTTCVLTSVLVKHGPNATGDSAEVGTSKPGLEVGVGTSPQVALLIRKNTATGGRQGRGRMYMPGLPEIHVETSGTYDATQRAAAQTRFTDFLGDLEAAGLPMVLLHAGPGSEPEPFNVLSLTVDSRVATQRRRNRP